jgi:hypothetical protein
MLIYVDEMTRLGQSLREDDTEKKAVASGRRYRRLESIPNSPEGLIATLYQNAVEPLVRQAYLNYLLQYQHYNAEFTVSECKHLGYPTPLCAPQEVSGYTRTDPDRIGDLTESWMNRFVYPHLSSGFKGFNKAPEFIKFCPLDIVDTLRNLYSYKFELRTISEWHERPRKGAKNQIVIVPITLLELAQHPSGEALLQLRLKEIPAKNSLESLRKASIEAKFLFILRLPEASTSIIWGTLWDLPKKNSILRFKGMKDGAFFGYDFLDIMNKFGAVADRTGLNRMITSTLGEEDWEQDRQTIGVTNEPVPSVEKVDPKASMALWEQFIQSVSDCNFSDDPGCGIYKEAVLRWNAIFLKQYGLTEELSPLLCEQVIPWMTPDGSLLQWAKGYQNLCEIVMLGLQAHPEMFSELNLQEAIRSEFDRNITTTLSTDIALLPYGMTAAAYVLETLIAQNKNPESPLRISSVEQHYFETLNILDKFHSNGSIIKSKCDSIEKLESCPDILITDFHPNNVVRKKLFPNRVAEWVFEQLTKDPHKKLKLILDITLNHFSDDIIRKTLGMLMPFIEEGRLEIYLIQSVAKLVQLGADNFSGGLLVHLSAPKKDPSSSALPRDLIEKEQYFTLLLREFNDIARKYFDNVRSNTDIVYRLLSRNFADIRDDVKIKNTKKRFCAVEVTMNSDESTCYVALNFAPILALLNIDNDNLERLTREFAQTLQEIAQVRELPVTGRQSFGFTFSNMSVIHEVIRFSIGVENRKHLVKNCQMIIDFVEILSIYGAEKHDEYDENTLFTTLKKSFGVIPCNDELRALRPIPMLKEYIGRRKPTPWGTATFSADKGKITVHATITESNEQRDFSEKQLGLRYVEVISSAMWRRRNSTILLYRLLISNPPTINLSFEDGIERCIIGGLISNTCLLKYYHDSHETADRLHVEFTPSFKITGKTGKVYSSDKIVTVIESLSPTPVKISRLLGEELDQFYNRCVRWVWNAEENQDGLLVITFVKEKPFRDYVRWINKLGKRGSLSWILKELNQINIAELPLSHQHCWNHAVTGKEAIQELLFRLGNKFADSLTEEVIELVQALQYDPFYFSFVEGMLSYALNPDKELSAESAALFARVFKNRLPVIHIQDDRIDSRLSVFVEYLQYTPGLSENYRNHIIALEPVLLHYFRDENELLFQDSSAAAKELAFALGYRPLLDHFDQLEDALICRMCSISSPEMISSYFKFYMRYPWEQKKEDLFLHTLSQCARPILRNWVCKTDSVVHLDIPGEHKYWDDLGGDEITIGDCNREQLHKFFHKLDLYQIIYDLEAKSAISSKRNLLRWAISLRDENLKQFLCATYNCTLPLLEQLEELDVVKNPRVKEELLVHLAKMRDLSCSEVEVVTSSIAI